MEMPHIKLLRQMGMGQNSSLESMSAWCWRRAACDQSSSTMLKRRCSVALNAGIGFWTLSCHWSRCSVTCLQISFGSSTLWSICCGSGPNHWSEKFWSVFIFTPFVCLGECPKAHARRHGSMIQSCCIHQGHLICIGVPSDWAIICQNFTHVILTVCIEVYAKTEWGSCPV